MKKTLFENMHIFQPPLFDTKDAWDRVPRLHLVFTTSHRVGKHEAWAVRAWAWWRVGVGFKVMRGKFYDMFPFTPPMRGNAC
eukprot:m.25717 g.25717  ORF g.25717 m.25717 type:complete len:82 (+) comp5794_c0_seq1:574-819(+)